MSSLVPGFLINSVLRQARRFSAGLATSPEPGLEPGRRRRHSYGLGLEPGHENAISESDEHSTQEAPGHPPNAAAMAAPRAAGTASGAGRQEAQRLQGATLMDTGEPGPTRPGAAPGDEHETSNGPGQRGSATATPLPEEYHADGCLPADDGMGGLRRRIHTIQLSGIAPSEKAQMMHQLLIEGYTQAQQFTSPSRLSPRPGSPASPTVWEQPIHPGTLESLRFWKSSAGDELGSTRLALTEEDLLPTYAPPRRLDDPQEWPELQDMEGLAPAAAEDDGARRLGCEHYKRNVKMQCATCERWYTCRLCHDAVEDHVLPRHETKYMLCMLCGGAQKASDTCGNCGESAAQYYCSICRLWSDDVDKPVYHCTECGICRVGRGLGKDFFHCKKCQACIAVSIESTHKCIERATDSDCPICGEYMFSSQRTVVFMDCGHSIHKRCREEHLKRSYKCPICSKSITNMAAQFRTLDIAVAAQPMPDEYARMRAVVLCNDCSAKTTTRYHWLGLKCAMCNSYNTVQLQLLRDEEDRAAAATTTAAAAEVARHIPLPQSPLSPHTPGTPLSATTTTTQMTGFPLPGRPRPAETGEEEEEDMLDFWGGDAPRSTTSAENADDDSDDSDDEDSDSDDSCDEDVEDEDDEEEISLFGHR